MITGLIIQILLGVLTFGLFILDDITIGEAVILAVLGGIYNRVITVHQDIHLLTNKEENNDE